MYMRRVLWLFLAAMFAVGLLAVAVQAQDNASMSDQGTVSQSTTTEQSTVSSSTTTVAPAPTVAPAVPAGGYMATCPAGSVAYVPANEVTLTGRVVTRPILGTPSDVDYQMGIQTPDGVTHRIWLAPQPYLRSLRFGPRVNDQVSVIGIPIGTSGDIIARQITWRDRAYDFRTVQGAPMWVAPAPGVVGVAPVAPVYGAAPGAFSEYGRMWNRRQLRTVSGTIDRIENYYPNGEAGGAGVAIRIQMSGLEPDMVPSWQQPPGELRPNFVWVHLGPAWYVQQQLPDLRVGQFVTVTGSPIVYHHQDVILASSIQQGTNVVAFRGPRGYPMWAGGWMAWQGPVTAYAPGYQVGMQPVYPANFQVFSGTIQSVQHVPDFPNMGDTTIITLRTADGRLVNVAVAPTSFYTQQANTLFLPGNLITVAGPISTMGNQQVVIANQIDYNGQRFAMSNVNGVFTWSPVTSTAALGPSTAMTPTY